jgi:uncharacterized protein DUF4337
MEVKEAAEKIQETIEKERAVDEHYRRRAAVAIGVMAMLLAIASLAGERASKEIINNNILASDTWAFYQAKNIRQTVNQLAADQLDLILITQPGLSPAARAATQKRIAAYRREIARFENEPDPADPANVLKGVGKQQLTARARALEEKRDHAQRQLPSFEFAQALFQLGIVLGSVSIVASSRPLLGLALALAAVATLLMLNGLFFGLELPLI